MAYTPHEWTAGETITHDLLNALEQGVANEQVGPAGEAGPAGAKGDTGAAGKNGTNGADGLNPKALALTTDADGKLTGGTLTLSDGSTIDITVTTTPAS